MKAIEDLNASETYQKIAELEAVLLAGETASTIDGTSSTVDLGVIRQQLSALYRLRDRQNGVPDRKPRFASIDVGGMFG